MSKIFKKSNIMPVIVLTVICLVIAAVLGVANMLTEDRIAFNEEQKKYESLKVVIDGTFAPIDKPAGAPKSVQDVFKVTDEDGKLKGYAVTLKVQGYASVISLTVGVSSDGSVTNAVVTSQAESHGKAGMANYTDKFKGVAKDELANVDTFSGATVSSTAIKSAIIDAVNTVTGNISEEETEIPLPREESEILAAAKTLIGKDVELTNVTPKDMEYARRIYKAGNEGYVAYTVVISQNYGTVETETLVYVGNSGAIKSVNKLVWKTSDAVETPAYSYYPPSEDTVNAFYTKLVGKKVSDLKAFEKTDLVSNATNTSTSLRDALVEALEAIDVLISKDMPTPEDQLIPLINDMIGKEVELTNVTPDDMKYARRIYKAGNEGYVAYTVVISQNYGTVETETLVHVGADGVIKNVKKMIWKTSDAVEGLYQPPTADIVDAFYAKLVGKKASDIKAFEKTDLVSNATSTSTNLRDALVEALDEIETLARNDMPTAEADVKALASALIGKETALTDVTPKNMQFVRRIWSAGDDGYIVYAVVISANYGTVETETLIHVGADGAIENVKKMIWKTSDAVETPYYSYYPPSEEVVNAFYSKLIGKKLSDLEAFEAADLVSNATNTSTNLRDAIAEGLEAVEEIESAKCGDSTDYTARILGIALLSVAILGFAAYKIVPIIKKRRKNG